MSASTKNDAMFRPNCRAIFRLIFERVKRKIGNAYELQGLVLQELIKIIAVCYIKGWVGPVAQLV